jgi:hypothetical protein
MVDEKGCIRGQEMERKAEFGRQEKKDRNLKGARVDRKGRRGKRIGMQGPGMDRRQGKVTGSIERTRVC